MIRQVVLYFFRKRRFLLIAITAVFLSGCAPLKTPAGQDFAEVQAAVSQEPIAKGHSRLVIYFQHHKKQIGKGGIDVKLNGNLIISSLGWQKSQILDVRSGKNEVSVGTSFSPDCSLPLDLKEGGEIYIRIWMKDAPISVVGFLLDATGSALSGTCRGFYLLAAVNGEFASSEMKTWK